MTGLYILLAIVAALSLTSLVLGVMLLIRNKKRGVDNHATYDDVNRLDKDVTDAVKMSNGMLAGSVNAQAAQLGTLIDHFDRHMVALDAKFDRIREENARNLADVKTSNTLELEKMRSLVDEKLTTTLDQRFNQSFKIVNDRLEEINKEFAELQNLQTSVKDLNGIFKNVKTRGTWGEVSLENLLEQILTPDQYERQFQISKGNDLSRVDFAVKLPGTGEGVVYLPIDAKFPIEDYQRLVDASSSGNVAETEQCTKALNDAVMRQARSIRDKYIRPTKTTDFAVMYLPVEGLYAEVVKQSGILERLQSECRVVVCGPTTLSALLNSLRMGFRSVAIEKRSQEIGKLLGQFQKDFVGFSKYLTQLKERMARVQDSIENAEKRSNSIGTRLSKVTKLDVGAEEIDLLGDVQKIGVDDLNADFDSDKDTNDD